MEIAQNGVACAKFVQNNMNAGQPPLTHHLNGRFGITNLSRSSQIPFFFSNLGISTGLMLYSSKPASSARRQPARALLEPRQRIVFIFELSPSCGEIAPTRPFRARLKSNRIMSGICEPAGRKPSRLSCAIPTSYPRRMGRRDNMSRFSLLSLTSRERVTSLLSTWRLQDHPPLFWKDSEYR